MTSTTHVPAGTCRHVHMHSLEQAVHNRLDIEALEVNVGLAAAHKHDWRTRCVHHRQRCTNLRAPPWRFNGALRVLQFIRGPSKQKNQTVPLAPHQQRRRDRERMWGVCTENHKSEHCARHGRHKGKRHDSQGKLETQDSRPVIFKSIESSSSWP